MKEENIVENLAIEKLVLKTMEENREQFKEKMASILQERLLDDLGYSYREQIGKTVAKFIEEELTEDIIKELKKKKKEIIKSFVSGYVKIGATIAEHMLKKVTENLSSWSGKEALKKLLD
jgi:tRNA(Met) C34 N-acetyltransferase TmcA